MGNGVEIEESHGRPRPVVRLEHVTPPETVDTDPCRDPETGRVGMGNRLARRRLLKRRAEGIATIAIASAPTWLRPHLEAAKPYVTSLLAVLEGRPALHPLAGTVADAYVLFRALTSLAMAAEGKERAALLGEARGWLREHRGGLVSLLALAGNVQAPPGPEDTPWIVDVPDEPAVAAPPGPEEPTDGDRDAEDADGQE